TQQEGDSQGNCGERVTEVVDEVGQQCDRTRQYEDERLSDGGEAEHSEGDEHGAHALARALDGVMNKAVGVAMVVMAGGMLLTAVRVVVLGMVMSKMHMLVLVDVSVLRRTHLTPPEARRCGPTCCDLGADARRGRWPVRATLPRGRHAGHRQPGARHGGLRQGPDDEARVVGEIPLRAPCRRLTPARSPGKVRCGACRE